MGKLLPILLALVGAGAGIGAGFLTRPPPPEEMANPCGDPVEGATEPAAPPPAEPEVPTTFVKLNNQFIVPVLAEGRVQSLVVMSLSIEITAETPDAVFAREPKLRDAFLQVLFDHANAGGFTGNFTAGTSMTTLRRALGEAATQVLGPVAVGVLIEDIVRQDT